MYFIQHCFICHLSDSTVSEGSGIEPKTDATLELVVRRSRRKARSHSHPVILPRQAVLLREEKDSEGGKVGIEMSGGGGGGRVVKQQQIKRLQKAGPLPINFFLQHFKQKKGFDGVTKKNY